MLFKYKALELVPWNPENMTDIEVSEQLVSLFSLLNISLSCTAGSKYIIQKYKTLLAKVLTDSFNRETLRAFEEERKWD